MGSHSVTCQPTQANAPHLNPSHAGWYSVYLPRRDGRLSWPSWLDSAPAGGRTSDLSITSPRPKCCTTKTTYVRCIVYANSSLKFKCVLLSTLTHLFVRKPRSQINHAALSEWICYLRVGVVLYRRNDILLSAVQSNSRWFAVLTRCRVSHHDADLWRSVNITLIH